MLDQDEIRIPTSLQEGNCAPPTLYIQKCNLPISLGIYIDLHVVNSF